MNPAVFQQPFFQMTLPIMVTFIATIWLASWSQNKRFDEITRRLESIDRKLESIDRKLEDHGNRIVALEERTSPLRGLR